MIAGEMGGRSCLYGANTDGGPGGGLCTGPLPKTQTRPVPGLLRAGRPELYDDPVMPGADMYDRRPPPPPRR